MKKIIFLFVVMLYFPFCLLSQTIYEPISNVGIYEFLDEMANKQLIILNSTVKPYSRTYIYEKLQDINKNISNLTERQKQELSFYLNSFLLENNKIKKEKCDIFPKNVNLSSSFSTISIIYKDTFLRVLAKPIWGINYFKTSNGNVYHRWGGAEVIGYIGNNWSFYASLIDNHESEIMTSPAYMNQNVGAPQKFDGKGGGDFSEMNGGIMYNWSWGSFGLIKDHFVWGDNYNGSNILSGKSPSFAHIKLSVKPAKWLEFNYIHGLLNSEVVDSSRSYISGNTNRTVFRDKYIAANLVTITPFKNLNISMGNSIVYSDVGIQLAYLIPVFFYKSVDHTLNSTGQFGEAGQNSQMFLNICSRQLKRLHLYSSLYIDELSITNMFDGKKESNFISFKIGGCLTDFLIKNISIIAEYTRTNPFAYQHFLPATTFENNHFTLGSYLKDNAKEIYLSIIWKPLRGLHLQAAFDYAVKGNLYHYGDSGVFAGLPYIKDKTWQSKSISLKATYEVIYNTTFFVEVNKSNIEGFTVDGKSAQYYLDLFTPKSFQGNQFIINTGIAIGF